MIQDKWLSPSNEDPNNLPSVCEKPGLTVEEEEMIRGEGLQFIINLGRNLNLPRLTWSTALVFYHRFFSRQSLLFHSPLSVAIACLFLACKVEETPKKIQIVIGAARDVRVLLRAGSRNRWKEAKKEEIERCKKMGSNTDVMEDELLDFEGGAWVEPSFQVKSADYMLAKDRILLLERIVLHTLSFDINIVHPYKALLDAMKQLHNKCIQNGLYNRTIKAGPESKLSTQEVFQLATGLVNDTYLTRLCLISKPEVIAKSCIIMALEALNAAQLLSTDWFGTLKVSKEEFFPVFQMLEKRSTMYEGVVKRKDTKSDGKLEAGL